MSTPTDATSAADPRPGQAPVDPARVVDAEMPPTEETGTEPRLPEMTAPEPAVPEPARSDPPTSDRHRSAPHRSDPCRSEPWDAASGHAVTTVAPACVAARPVTPIDSGAPAGHHPHTPPASDGHHRRDGAHRGPTPLSDDDDDDDGARPMRTTASAVTAAVADRRPAFDVVCDADGRLVGDTEALAGYLEVVDLPRSVRIDDLILGGRAGFVRQLGAVVGAGEWPATSIPARSIDLWFGAPLPAIRAVRAVIRPGDDPATYRVRGWSLDQFPAEHRFEALADQLRSSIEEGVGFSTLSTYLSALVQDVVPGWARIDLESIDGAPSPGRPGIRGVFGPGLPEGWLVQRLPVRAWQLPVAQLMMAVPSTIERTDRRRRWLDRILALSSDAAARSLLEARMHDRPAYQRGLEKGGPYELIRTRKD